MLVRSLLTIVALLTVPMLPAPAMATAAGRPNILFCIADDASYPYMGAYGCKWVETPGFDRVAREGLLFTRAYTPNAKCAPSRACILTGRNSWQLKAACNHVPYFPKEIKTYAEALTEHGYFVGKTAKGWAPGIALDANGHRRNMAGVPFDKRRAKPPARGIAPSDYAGNFEEFLNAAPENEPWCFWYGCYEPHRGYEYGSGLAKGGKHLKDVSNVPDIWPDTEIVRTDMLDYAFEVEHFDRHLVRMLAMLEQRGQLDNTLVIVTADNGMPFPRAKGQEYEISNHLPLAIMWKQGIRHTGRRIDDFVSFIDFAPTFVELAGLNWADTGMKPSPGKSLTDIFRSDQAGQVNPNRDHVLIGKERHDIGRPHDWGYPIRGIFKGDMLYLKNFEPTRWPAGNPETGYLNTDGSPTKTLILDLHRRNKQTRYWDWAFGKRAGEELYDLKTDPQCLKNLAGQPNVASQQNALKSQLEQELKEQQDPRMFGHGHVFDEYPYANRGDRGFYERYMRGEKLRAGWVSSTDFEQRPADKPGTTDKEKK